jgi:hypothetical protein
MSLPAARAPVALPCLQQFPRKNEKKKKRRQRITATASTGSVQATPRHFSAAAFGRSGVCARGRPSARVSGNRGKGASELADLPPAS